MTTQYRAIAWQSIKDAGVRAALKDVDRWLRGIFRNLIDQLSTDPKTGRLRLRASIILRDVGVNPSVVSTEGQAGELVRFGERIFTRSQEGAALEVTKRWSELPTSGFVTTATRIDTGLGLTGGGDLSVDRTHSIDFAVVEGVPEVRVDPVAGWPAGTHFGQRKIFDGGPLTPHIEYHWLRSSDGSVDINGWVQVVRAKT